MSQKVAIRRVRVHGTPYLGVRVDSDSAQVDAWSSSPDEVMNWLCDGFRTRYNQHRSTRSRYAVDDEGTISRDQDGKPVLVPLGERIIDISDKQARVDYPHLAAVPAMVLQAPAKLEAVEWFSAVRRRKTLASQGRPGGRMPGFVSRRRSDQRFVCWFNGGTNATFRKTGRKSGIVTIRGKNPAGKYGPSASLSWRVNIHVRLSQAIRPYTSVRVNWTRRELVFVNAPVPVTGRAANGEAVGLDAGVVHTLADSHGKFYDAPDTSHLETRRRYHQRRMAKSRLVAEREGRQFWASKRYQAHKAAAAAISAKIARVRADWQHKTSTDLVRRYDLIGVEDLNLAGMVRRARGNRVAQKRGLNRALHTAALAQLVGLIEYKAKTSGTWVVRVPAPYTSQQCSACGHVAPGNRESQAVFRCQECTHEMNADVNAAKNIEAAAVTEWARTQPSGVAQRGASARPKRPPRREPGQGGEALPPRQLRRTANHLAGPPLRDGTRTRNLHPSGWRGCQVWEDGE